MFSFFCLYFGPFVISFFTHPVSNAHLHRPNLTDAVSKTMFPRHCFSEHVSWALFPRPCFVLWSSYTLFPRTSFEDPRPYFFEIFCNPFSQTLFLRPFCTSWATTLVLHILTCPDPSCGLPMVGDLLTLSSSLNLTMSGGSRPSMGLAPAPYMALDWLHLQHGHQQHHCQDGHQLQHIGQPGPTTPEGQRTVHTTPPEGHTTPREGHTTPPEGHTRDQSPIVTGQAISSQDYFICWVIYLNNEL